SRLPVGKLRPCVRGRILPTGRTTEPHTHTHTHHRPTHTHHRPTGAVYPRAEPQNNTNTHTKEDFGRNRFPHVPTKSITRMQITSLNFKTQQLLTRFFGSFPLRYGYFLK